MEDGVVGRRGEFFVNYISFLGRSIRKLFDFWFYCLGFGRGVGVVFLGRGCVEGLVFLLLVGFIWCKVGRYE